MNFIWQQMRTAKVKPLRGTFWKCSSPKSRLSAWCFTKSPRKPLNGHSKTPAKSTTTSCTRRKPAASLTACTATKSRPFCGARSVPVCPPAVCSPLPPAWLSNANVSAWRSFRLITGTSTSICRLPGRPKASRRNSPPLTGRRSPRAATSLTKAR